MRSLTGSRPSYGWYLRGGARATRTVLHGWHTDPHSIVYTTTPSDHTSLAALYSMRIVVYGRRR